LEKILKRITKFLVIHLFWNYNQMEKLTKVEEEIMLILWDLNKAFVKDIIEQMPEPKPHYNTVSTMIKILQEKGFVDYTA
jgi:predicted transcriptional regulator